MFRGKAKDTDLQTLTQDKSDVGVETPLLSEAPRGYNASGSFQERYGYNWDWVVVFPFGPKKDQNSTPSMKPDEIVRRLNNAGLQTFLYYSVQKDEIYCKIRAPLDRLEKHADLINLKMLLDEDKLKDAAEFGMPEKSIGPIIITHDPTITKRRPYDQIYGPYDTAETLKALFANSEGLPHPFGAVYRIKLIKDIFQTSTSSQGCGLNMDTLLRDKSILAMFPLHNLKARDALAIHWLNPWSWPWEQPLDMIRLYFGEKVTLYFTFIGHYTTWLFPLSILGFAVFCDVLGEGYNTQAQSVPFFCFFVAFWATLMLEYWKRTEATKSLEWGMTGYEEEERDRPEFEGIPMKSYIDGQDMKYYPSSERTGKLATSTVVILSMIILVIAAVTGVFVLNIVLGNQSGWVGTYGSDIASFINALQIQFMNMVYGELAVFLTKRENHRTATEYEDSLIGKLFAFQFVNSYSSLFYVAFIKKYAEGECSYDTCMDELSYSLGIIFITRLVLGNMSEILTPRISQYLKRKAEMEGVPHGAVLSKPENEYTMLTYDELMGTLTDYSELSIQFGYVTLFVTAFPLSPLLAFVSNYAEIRTDAVKLLYFYRRPIPSGAEDIGTWQAILTITASIAVITNAGMICFTMDILDDYSNVTKVWIFIVFQYAVFVLMGMFSYLVPDVPEDVQIQLRRREFLVEKVIKQVADEDDDFALEAEASPMQVYEYDDDPAPGSLQ